MANRHQRRAPILSKNKTSTGEGPAGAKKALRSRRRRTLNSGFSQGNAKVKLSVPRMVMCLLILLVLLMMFFLQKMGWGAGKKASGGSLRGARGGIGGLEASRGGQTNHASVTESQDTFKREQSKIEEMRLDNDTERGAERMQLEKRLMTEGREDVEKVQRRI